MPPPKNQHTPRYPTVTFVVNSGADWIGLMLVTIARRNVPLVMMLIAQGICFV
jgi:hypothetical protein